MLSAVGEKEGVLRCGLVRVVLLWWGGPLCWHVLAWGSKDGLRVKDAGVLIPTVEPHPF